VDVEKVSLDILLAVIKLSGMKQSWRNNSHSSSQHELRAPLPNLRMRIDRFLSRDKINTTLATCMTLPFRAATHGRICSASAPRNVLWLRARWTRRRADKIGGARPRSRRARPVGTARRLVWLLRGNGASAEVALMPMPGARGMPGVPVRVSL
jgi:hypothetical protein